MLEQLNQIRTIIEELKNNSYLNEASKFIAEMPNGNNPMWLMAQGGMAQGQIKERQQLEQDAFEKIENLLTEIEEANQ